MPLHVDTLDLDNLAADPGAPDDGSIWYNTTENAVKARINGVTLVLSQDKENTIYVAKSGAPYDTITAGLAAASSGDTVLVSPGVYAESVTVPAGVTLKGEGGSHVTQITGSAATGTRVTMNAGSVIDGLKVTLPTDALPAIVYSGASLATGRDIRLIGAGASGIGVRNSGAGSFEIMDLFYESGDCDTVCEVTAGELFIREGIVSQSAGAVGFGARASAGVFGFESYLVRGGSLVTALQATGTGSIIGATLECQSVTNGLRLSSDSGSIEIRASRFDGLTNDILVDAGLTDGRIHVSGSEMSDNKFNTPAGWFDTADVVLGYQDEVEGDKSHRFLSELHVGRPECGRETVLGEGDSYTQGMVVLTTDSTAGPASDGGNLTDVSAEAASAEGSTFTFQGTAAGHAIMWGSSLEDASGTLKFWGMKMAQTVAAVEVTPLSFIWEIWNGAAWTEVNVMATDADTPYESHANAVFLRANSSEQIRAGITPSTTWARKSISGNNLYWFRVRITANLTTAPVFQQSKLHCSRFEVNADGQQECFGNARQTKDLLWHQRLQDDLAGSSPGNRTINFASGISLTPIDNGFVNGVVDGVGETLAVPDGLDTSLPLTLEIVWVPSTNNTGDVELESRHAVIAAVGSVLDGTIASTLLTDITTVALNTIDTTYRTTFEFSIPTAETGDLLALTYFRDATAGNPDDTFVGNVEIAFTRLRGIFWR